MHLRSFADHYNTVLFAYGASKDRKLGVEGEDDLNGIYSARDFVGWYNGLPGSSNLAPRLDVSDTAAIIGQGNVAMDVARTLLKDVDTLRHTDMPDHALAVLSRSRVRKVHIVGRRGPMQLASTIKEVRELMKLPKVAFSSFDQNLLPSDISSLPRTAKRLTKLLKEGSPLPGTDAQKEWRFDFLMAPEQFRSAIGAPLPQLNEVAFRRTKFASENDVFRSDAKVESTESRISIKTGLAFKSIGYQSEELPGMRELGICFDGKKGIIINDDDGRLLTQMQDKVHRGPLPGLYCAGWVKRGPAGVIANTMEDSFATAEAIVEDWKNQVPFLGGGGDGWHTMKDELSTKNPRPVTWEDWLKIDEAEKTRGRLLGKEREKFTNPQEMLKVLD